VAADAEAAARQVRALEVRPQQAVPLAQRAPARQARARQVAVVRDAQAAVAATRHHHARRTHTC
jgi:hypothetical protein